MALTKTNTDNLCCPTATAAESRNNNHHSLHFIYYFAKKLKYRYYLWTGLYMLEPHERVALHFVVGPMIVALILYVGIFVNGIREGWFGR